jgi:ribonuclease P protein component
LNRKDFVNLNRLGKRFHTKHFTLIYKKTEAEFTRVGITVGRKIGNAVRRNRIKRLVREYYRLNKKRFPVGFDIVIVAKKGAHCLNYTNIKEELSEIVLD